MTVRLPMSNHPAPVDHDTPTLYDSADPSDADTLQPWSDPATAPFHDPGYVKLWLRLLRPLAEERAVETEPVAEARSA